MFAYIILGSLLIELITNFTDPVWRFRKIVSIGLLLVLGFSEGIILANPINLLGIICAVVVLFRMINAYRIIEARMHQVYLRKSTRRTSLVLGGLQLAVLAGLHWPPDYKTYHFQLLAIMQAVAAMTVLLISLRNILKSRHQSVTENYADRDLPTLTVALPARDETTDLEECLRALLTNDYPKLEILVLDDCSQQSRTPEIIRSFAHDGVRFLQGSEPEERWLAKNQAYEQLAREASGDLILFCGVDVRFGPQALKALVTTLLSRDKTMISVLPRGTSTAPLASLVQPMRYWWELALPRRFFNRPPVLSTCWLIKKKALIKLGGFKAVSHAIIPEGYFAREVIKDDGYSFIRAGNILDITSSKKLSNQFETAIRMRYPQIRRRLELSLLLSTVIFVFLLLPFILLFTAIWHVMPAYVVLLNSLACLALITTHIAIVLATNPGSLAFSLVNFPLVVIVELALGNYSMYKYEFSTVDWKGRNICIPVMHTIPKLPDLSKD